MTQGNEPVLFAAQLRPHRSLSRAGFVAVMAVLGGASLAAGSAFLLAGAWPVLGFYGLDVLLVWLLFRANLRAARAFEAIRITPNRLNVRQVSARGDSRESEFNPRWVRLEAERHHEWGVTRVALVSRGAPLVVGSFLSPDMKEWLAGELRSALALARR
jgi:uncharacterized membrane protein